MVYVPLKYKQTDLGMYIMNQYVLVDAQHFVILRLTSTFQRKPDGSQHVNSGCIWKLQNNDLMNSSWQ